MPFKSYPISSRQINKNTKIEPDQTFLFMFILKKMSPSQCVIKYWLQYWEEKNRKNLIYAEIRNKQYLKELIYYNLMHGGEARNWVTIE